MSLEDAIGRIPDGATVAIGGTGAVLEPDLLLQGLEARFLASGKPAGLTIFAPMMPGDQLGIGGFNRLAHPGMVRRIYAASFSTKRHPGFIDLLRNGSIEGYIIGMGAMVQLLTAAGARRPGVWTAAGLGTFLDPRQEGGALNERSSTLPVSLQTIEGQEYLFYPTIPIDVAIIRATTADENGYLSFEEEPNVLCMLEMAAAAKANGGLVIAQVKRIARADSLDARLVRVPGALVDCVVCHPAQTQVSPGMTSPLEGWNPAFVGALKAPLSNIPAMPAGLNRLILRRAALALESGDVANVGAGIPTFLPHLCHDERILKDVVFTNEHGIFGGLMATAVGGSFVPAFNPGAIMASSFQFDFYESGGLDIAFLGIGQVDGSGSVNVSRFADELNGPGGFMSIADRTKRIVFCGALTAGGLSAAFEHGKLQIAKEGRKRKFVRKVEQITFNGPRAAERGQEVLYITERCVFRLTAGGVELSEVAPGVDIERDIVPQIDFPLRKAADLRLTDRRVYLEGSMGLDEPAADTRRAAG